MFTIFPGSKTYFSHLDISPRSPHLLSHGKKIILAIAEGAQDISQLAHSLSSLQTLHAYRLRIDPTNFKVPLTSLLHSHYLGLGFHQCPAALIYQVIRIWLSLPPLLPSWALMVSGAAPPTWHGRPMALWSATAGAVGGGPGLFLQECLCRGVLTSLAAGFVGT